MGEEFQIALESWNENPYNRNKSHYNLWGAVLYLGVYDFRCAALKLGHVPSTREEIAEIEPYYLRQAIRWLMCDTYLPSSYTWICSMLGIDAITLRKRILEKCCENDWTGLFVAYNTGNNKDEN